MHYLKLFKSGLLRAWSLSSLTLMTIGVLLFQNNSLGDNLEQSLTLGSILIIVMASEVLT